jgi:hypothetical protein
VLGSSLDLNVVLGSSLDSSLDSSSNTVMLGSSFDWNVVLNCHPEPTMPSSERGSLGAAEATRTNERGISGLHYSNDLNRDTMSMSD